MTDRTRLAILTSLSVLGLASVLMVPFCLYHDTVAIALCGVAASCATGIAAVRLPLTPPPG